MDGNFHYHVTYTAAVMAGFSPEDGEIIARAARYVDECEGVTVQAVTTLIWDNLLDTFSGETQLRTILNIWPVFHFLPGDYTAIESCVDPQLRNNSRTRLKTAPKLICGTESALVAEMVEETKRRYQDGQPECDREKKLQRIGISMHVLADTFAHQDFAGIPLACINAVDEVKEAKQSGDFEKKWYLPFEYSAALSSESFGYLGHGRIGHLVDQPGACFAYQAAWKNPTKDNWIVRYNPFEFYCAYCQMVEAMEYINGKRSGFSRYVNRAALLNPRLDTWGTVKRFLEALESARTDADLPEPWYRVIGAVKEPQEYRPYRKENEQNSIDGFRDEVEEHRLFVQTRCTPLKEYME